MNYKTHKKNLYNFSSQSR